MGIMLRVSGCLEEVKKDRGGVSLIQLRRGHAEAELLLVIKKRIVLGSLICPTAGNLILT